MAGSSRRRGCKARRTSKRWACIIDLAQLHGSETEDYILRLWGLMRRGELIKAARVRSAADIQAVSGLPVEYLLLDAFSEKEYGGTGEVFDWGLARYLGDAHGLVWIEIEERKAGRRTTCQREDTGSMAGSISPKP